ncbi:MAG: hypothetical protein AAF225_00735 [Pseudomonadota bacterium]
MGIIGTLYRRHRSYTVIGLMTLALLPFLLVLMQIDDRTLDGANVWLKPVKFQASLGTYSLTLAFFAAWMSEKGRNSLIQRVAVFGFAVAMAFEVVWLISASAQGIRSHFNIDGGLYTFLYPFSGLFAMVLVFAALVMGVSVLRARKTSQNEGLAEAIGWSLVLTFFLTPIAGTMLSMPMADYGGSKNGYNDGIFGWRMEGGDLRAAHFFATHALHLIPAAIFVPSLFLPKGLSVALARLLSLTYAAVILWFVAHILSGGDLPEIFRSPI